MIVTPTLSATGVGNSASPNGWTSAPNGALTLIGAGGQDTNFAHDASNLAGTTTQDQGYEVNTFPADLYGMLTLTVQLRYGWASSFSNRTWNSLSARIMSGATVLAGSTLGGGFETVVSGPITNTSPVDSSVVSFSYVNQDARRATWESAIMEMRIDTTRSAGGSSIERRVYAAQFTGTYSTGTTMKAYSGTVWQAGMLKRYTAGEWKPATAKRWNGTAWVQEFGKA
jgi:hypothetical protein